jgi:hypothetical protein
MTIHTELAQPTGDAVDDFLTELLLSVGGKPLGIRELDAADRAAYMREAKRASRARQRAARAAAADGQPVATALPSADEVREVLADAALLLLAVDGPGADQVRHVLARALPTRAGLPSLVTSKAKSGRLRTRSPGLRVEALKRAHTAS